jgi:ABC-type sugar transport system substrate-binding protein
MKRLTLKKIVGLLALSCAVAASAQGLPGAPAPFDKGGVKVALVAYLSAGDFYQAYQAGAQQQAKAALRANPDIHVVFAPYDEFARGVKLAAQELGIADKLRIYSADVSSADIQEITEPGSPWAATASTNPAVVGAVSVRAAALLLAGQDPGHHVLVEPVLLTQKQLRDAGVKTVEELSAELPAFGQSQAASAPWIKKTPL